MTRRLKIWGLALVAGLGLLYASPLVIDRAEPPRAERAAARRALERARRSAPAGIASSTFANAEGRFQSAVAEQLRRAAALFPLRDYRSAREAFLQAEMTALRSDWEHRRQAHADGARAQEAIAVAEEILDEGELFLSRLGADRHLWSTQSRAKQQLREARIRLAVGDSLAAGELAGTAADLGRETSRRASGRYARFVDDEQLQQWRGWRDETVAWTRRHRKAAIVVDKDAHSLVLFENGSAVRSFAIDLGSNSVAPKVQAGDDATPEGRYRVLVKKRRPETRFHKALLLDYPNAEDRRLFAARQRRGEVSPSAVPGSLIEIHGEGGRGDDWTRGCVAMHNDDIDFLYSRVENGTPVTIIGGLGTGHGLYTALAQRSMAAGSSR